jgi:hypothetical protein
MNEVNVNVSSVCFFLANPHGPSYHLFLLMVDHRLLCQDPPRVEINEMDWFARHVDYHMNSNTILSFTNEILD